MPSRAESFRSEQDKRNHLIAILNSPIFKEAVEIINEQNMEIHIKMDDVNLAAPSITSVRLRSRITAVAEFQRDLKSLAEPLPEPIPEERPLYGYPNEQL